MWRDDAHLLDMLIAARHAAAFVRNLTWEQFQSSALQQHAVAKALENIGEAAGKVSSEFRQAHPEIAWPQIIGLRHRIAHDYFRVDLLRIWEIVTMELPSLMATLEPFIPPDEED